jgi:hypothetical protein
MKNRVACIMTALATVLLTMLSACNKSIYQIDTTLTSKPHFAVTEKSGQLFLIKESGGLTQRRNTCEHVTYVKIIAQALGSLSEDNYNLVDISQDETIIFLPTVNADSTRAFLGALAISIQSISKKYPEENPSFNFFSIKSQNQTTWIMVKSYQENLLDILSKLPNSVIRKLPSNNFLITSKMSFNRRTRSSVDSLQNVVASISIVN